MESKTPKISTFIKNSDLKKLESDSISFQKKHTWANGTCACFGFDFKVNEITLGIGIDVFPENPIGYRFGLRFGKIIEKNDYKHFGNVTSYSIVLQKEAVNLVNKLEEIIKIKLKNDEKIRLLVTTGNFVFTETALLSKYRGAT